MDKAVVGTVVATGAAAVARIVGVDLLFSD